MTSPSPSPSHRSRPDSRTPRRSISPRSASPSPVRNLPRNGNRAVADRSPSPRRSRSYSRGRSNSRSLSRSRSASRSPPRSAKIVVEKLTKNVNEGHLQEIFGHYGIIEELDLPKNVQFNTNRGTAYILYDKVSSAESAIAHMHEAQLDGTIISVSIVLPRRRFSPSPPPRRASAFPPRGGAPYQPGPPGGGFGRGRPPPNSFGGHPRYRDSPGPPHRRSRSPRGGYRGRGGRNDGQYRRRSYSRSRSPRHSRSRSRSRSYSSGGSRSPPPRRGGGTNYRRHESPQARGSGGPTRRRSPSYGSYSNHSSRSRSRSRERGDRRR